MLNSVAWKRIVPICLTIKQTISQTSPLIISMAIKSCSHSIIILLVLRGIKQSIEARKLFPQQREVLVRELKNQYEGIPQPAKVSENIQSLLQPNTFTITTAHQPNIFTGPLYFIYKLLHVIKIAE